MSTVVTARIKEVKALKARLIGRKLTLGGKARKITGFSFPVLVLSGH